MARLLWTQKQNVGPRARSYHAMAFDARRLHTVLFGGSVPEGPAVLGDTWTWDGESWTQVDDLGPSARSGAALVYDAVRDRTVLFGGMDGTAPIGDTWEWDGEDWTQMADSGPPARYGHAMVFDATRRVTTLFGGGTLGGVLGDTWQWDGNEWAQVEDVGPSPRTTPMMAFDLLRARTVLFGGGSAGDSFGDTWEWDGTAWSQIAGFGPPACRAGAMVHNGRRALLFGGVTGTAGAIQVFSLTWEWDGRHWTVRQDMGPGPRFGHAMVFDTARNRGVLFGGMATSAATTPTVALGDTFEQFEQGAAPLPPPPPSDVGVESVVITPAHPTEGQPISVDVKLTGVAPPGAAVTILLQAPDGTILAGPAPVDVSGLSQRSVPFVLASDTYQATATLGASSTTVSFAVAGTSEQVTGLIGSPSPRPSGSPLGLRAVFTSPVPASGITVPLRVSIQGGPSIVWQGPQLQVPGNALMGTVMIDAEILDAIPLPSRLIWTATLGGHTVTTDVDLS